MNTENNPTIWFTADQHFHHKNVIAYDNRPFETLEEMHQMMIERWNERVKPYDIIYHLGDFSFGNIEKQKSIFERLNGEKYLVLGNHDRFSKCVKVGWKNVCRWMVFDGILLCHNPEIEMHWNGFMIHGHTHKPSKNTDRVCVSCNLWDYYPVCFEDIKKELMI